MNTWRHRSNPDIGGTEWSSPKYLWKAADAATRNLQIVTLFPFADYWWFYAGFTALRPGMLARRSWRLPSPRPQRQRARGGAVERSLDRAVAGLQRSAVSIRRRHVLARRSPGKVALEFLAGYVVEYTLSIDNMFVFVVIFSFFSVPSQLQHRVLFYGILGALIFRAIFIALGSVLLSYHAVVILFGVVLIVTGMRMLFHDSGNASPDRNPAGAADAAAHAGHRSSSTASTFSFASIGAWHATPLFLALMAIEMSDIVFAIDSVPAIFALTSEPLIVFTSNVFAILGLRSLYFVLAAAVARVLAACASAWPAC